MNKLTVMDLGRMAYPAAMDVQDRVWREVVETTDERAYLLLVEHDPPVITLGRRYKPEHILLSRDALAQRGIAVYEAGRGGDVTYHGPGQLVGYPIVRLAPRGGVADFVHAIEDALIRTVGDFGIAAERIRGLTGVWAGGAKLAAIGLAVRRGVSQHGFALNVDPNLADFSVIVPCGLRDKPVTSMAALLGTPPALADVKARITATLAEALGLTPEFSTGTH